MRTITATRTVALPIVPTFSAASTALVRRSTSTLRAIPKALEPAATRALGRLRQIQQQRMTGPAALQQLQEPTRFAVRGLDLRKREIMLPLGLDVRATRISAGALKKLAGGTKKEQLLKKTKDSWSFVPATDLIDLTDESIEYRLGTMAILS